MVRLANYGDASFLTDLAEDMAAESPRFSKFEVDRDKIALLVVGLIDSASGVIFVSTQDDIITGFMAGMISEHFFCSSLIAGDIGLYVVPEKRGSMTGVRLIKAFDLWAAEQGAHEVSISPHTGVEEQMVVKLLEKKGYTNQGVSMVKEL